MDYFPRLYTPNLILRQLEIDDVPALVKYANNKKISDRIVNMPHPYREPDGVFKIGYVYKGFEKKVRFVFSIISKEADELIGEIAIHLDDAGKQGELGYWIGEPFWGQGLMSEAVGAVVNFGFEKLGLELISATTNQDNLASATVLRKNGMKQYGMKGLLLQFAITAAERSIPIEPKK